MAIALLAQLPESVPSVAQFVPAAEMNRRARAGSRSRSTLSPELLVLRELVCCCGAKRDTSRAATAPTSPKQTSATIRSNPARVTSPAADRPRSSSTAPLRMRRCARRSPRPRRAPRRSHGSTHTRERGCLHATLCHTGSGTAASAPAWPSRRALVGASESVQGLPGSRQSPCSRLVQAHPEPGLLSSPGITRVPRSYEPLRRLTSPSPDGAVVTLP
jgi:hypothetical protein